MNFRPAAGFIAGLALLATRLAAQEAAAAPATGEDEQQELAELMDILEQETAVATRTRMNSDYVPGIVTVLEGDELEMLGVETVWEALSLVPGVQPVRGTASSPSTVVRGIQFPFNSGNIKVLLDGVPLTRQSSAVNGAVLALPIEQVERIEVIRGPGSVVYGDFAFMGLVNILTRKEGTRFHLRADDDEGLAVGARASWGAPAGWQLSANLALLEDGDADVTAPRRAEARRGTGVVSLRGGGFSLLAQAIDVELDDVAPPGTPGAPTDAEETSWAVEARYDRELADALRLSLRADLLATDVVGGPIRFEDQVERLDASLVWEGWEGQSWLAGVEYAAQDIERAALAPAGPPGRPAPPPVIADGRERDVASLVVQDRVDIGERWSVTAGARYDDYSDVGSRLTPRLSLVWRASDRHILKAQYAEGFRAPTFFEAYGRPGGRLDTSLEFEVNRTTEINYVYRRPHATGRATLFHSRLDDMIFIAAPGFANTREARAEGVELEWTQQLTGAIKLLASASWVDTEDDRGPTLRVHDSEAAADWMADLGLLVRTSARTVAALHWNHVDRRPALSDDQGYDLLDLTFTARDLGLPGLDLRLGLENALDDDVVYVQVPPTGIIAGNRYGRRSVWAQLSWRR